MQRLGTEGRCRGIPPHAVTVGAGFEGPRAARVSEGAPIFPDLTLLILTRLKTKDGAGRSAPGPGGEPFG